MSDPAQPEHAGRSAFAELETVVRHVTEQLAVYRRRALSAEAQVRDLEQVTARAAELARAGQASERRIAELERALAEAEASAAAAAEQAVRAAESAARAEAERPVLAHAAGGADAALVSENTALRERLAEAADHTRRISERVRFLRQQLGNGGDR